MQEPDDESMYAASARHAEIMQELQEFGNRLAWGCLGIVVMAIAAVYFFFKYHPFWKYP